MFSDYIIHIIQLLLVLIAEIFSHSNVHISSVKNLLTLIQCFLVARKLVQQHETKLVETLLVKFKVAQFLVTSTAEKKERKNEQEEKGVRFLDAERITWRSFELINVDGQGRCYLFLLLDSTLVAPRKIQ